MRPEHIDHSFFVFHDYVPEIDMDWAWMVRGGGQSINLEKFLAAFSSNSLRRVDASPISEIHGAYLTRIRDRDHNEVALEYEVDPIVKDKVPVEDLERLYWRDITGAQGGFLISEAARNVIIDFCGDVYQIDPVRFCYTGTDNEVEFLKKKYYNLCINNIVFMGGSDDYCYTSPRILDPRGFHWVYDLTAQTAHLETRSPDAVMTSPLTVEFWNDLGEKRRDKPVIETWAGTTFPIYTDVPGPVLSRSRSLFARMQNDSALREALGQLPLWFLQGPADRMISRDLVTRLRGAGLNGLIEADKPEPENPDLVSLWHA